MSTIEQILVIKGPDVIVASPQKTVLEAAKMMSDANVGSVVVREGDEIKGIFTERDLLCRLVARSRDPAATALSEVMSSPVRTCSLADDVDGVADELTREHIRHLAVVDKGALVGMISLRDVMAAQIRDTRQKIKDLEERAGLE
jgi:CBS domain-containing protein